MEFHVLYFQDTYSERTCIGTDTYACRRMREWYIDSQNEDGGIRVWSKDEKVKRNDFPSFFLNLVRLIDAPDRNEAINLIVSISIMAILREENESGNAKGDDWRGKEVSNERITFPNDRPGNLPPPLESYGTDCGLRVRRSKRRLMSAKEQFSILAVDLMDSRESPVCQVPFHTARVVRR